MKTIYQETKELNEVLGYFDNFKMDTDYKVVLSIPFPNSKVRGFAKAFGYSWNASEKSWYKITNFIEKQLVVNGKEINIQLKSI